MADVRALLRAERAQRAPPSKLSRKQQAAAAQAAAAAATSRKRKAEDGGDEEDSADSRKRVRADEVEDEEGDDGVKDGPHEDQDDEEEEALEGGVEQESQPIVDAVPQPVAANVDADEWAAFERDVATPPPDTNPVPVRANALSDSNTISAAPMTTAEIEAQKRKEAQVERRQRREEELQGVKEDAERVLEEEFEEMEALEARVRRLKEARENLRKGVDSAGVRPELSEATAADNTTKAGSEDESDSDAEDDWDNWGVRKTS